MPLGGNHGIVSDVIFNATHRHYIFAFKTTKMSFLQVFFYA